MFLLYLNQSIFLLLLLCITAPLCTYSASTTRQLKSKLLLISFDGFRWDYLTKTNKTPNFDKFINNGVKAKWVQDNFASVTFPNHYTIVTGLYEESHGIVANRFYDPISNKTFNYHNSTNVGDSDFWGGEPIWVTNQKQGGKSGVYYWVGSEAEIKGIRPTKYEKFVKTGPSEWPPQVDKVVEWLTTDDFNLALLYFPEPDFTGHRFGPESPEIVNMIETCDGTLGYLLKKLKERGILEEVNIIITSDHGMSEVTYKQAVFLSPPINMSKSVDKLFNFHTGALIWPKEGEEEVIYNSLKTLNSTHMTIWKKADIPDLYHYKNTPRMSPIFISPHNRWVIRENKTAEYFNRGDHGYNNSIMDMHTIFMAMGPQFRKKLVVEPFNNINIYSLLCELLGIQPAPNNGSINVMKHMLVNHQDKEEDIQGYDGISQFIGLICGASVVIILLIFIFKQGKYCKSKYRTTPYTELPITEDDQSQLLMETVRY